LVREKEAREHYRKIEKSVASGWENLRLTLNEYAGRESPE